MLIPALLVLLPLSALAQEKPRLRGLCVVDSRVAWASGAAGTVLRTIDGGLSWERRPVPGAEALDLRDVQAFDDRTAFALSIGPGDRSRITKTTDGGATWAVKHVNRDPQGFLDAIAFWDAQHGLALGDPVDGRFVILTTDDAGATWREIAALGMPPALPNEGAFAASGTCLVVQAGRNAWFGTGSGRVFRSTDLGSTWTVHATPLGPTNASSGIFSLAFRDSNHGVAVGGDYKDPGRAVDVVALTSDGGRTWRLPSGPGPRGYRSAVAFVPGTKETFVAVGPTGSDRSTDGGESWTPLGDLGFHTVGFADPSAGLAAGDDGRIERIATGR
jgi:photosystem II stability/assembly factor-like uncharacterized protein